MTQSRELRVETFDSGAFVFSFYCYSKDFTSPSTPPRSNRRALSPTSLGKVFSARYSVPLLIPVLNQLSPLKSCSHFIRRAFSTAHRSVNVAHPSRRGFASCPMGSVRKAHVSSWPPTSLRRGPSRPRSSLGSMNQPANPGLRSRWGEQHQVRRS